MGVNLALQLLKANVSVALPGCSTSRAHKWLCEHQAQEQALPQIRVRCKLSCWCGTVYSSALILDVAFHCVES